MSTERTVQVVLALQAGSQTQQQLQDLTGYSREGVSRLVIGLHAAGHIEPKGWGQGGERGSPPVLWGWK